MDQRSKFLAEWANRMPFSLLSGISRQPTPLQHESPPLDMLPRSSTT